MDIELPFDFKEFLKLLNENGVRYLLIGGYAVGYHGYPRATNDMDVWVAIHPDNAQRIVNVLKEFGFDHPELTPGLFLQKNKIIRMGHPPMRLEISTGISGVEFEECYTSRIVDDFDGVEVNIIDLYHLKENKKAAGFEDAGFAMVEWTQQDQEDMQSYNVPVYQAVTEFRCLAPEWIESAVSKIEDVIPVATVNGDIV